MLNKSCKMKELGEMKELVYLRVDYTPTRPKIAELKKDEILTVTNTELKKGSKKIPKSTK